MRKLLLVFLIGLSFSLHGQSYPYLETVLAKELPAASNLSGRWVFYADKADITKIEKPLFKSVFPNYDFFQVILTNYLGYHVNPGTCLILFDSSKAKILLVEPLWYGDVSEKFVKLFLNHKFGSKDSLLIFLKEVNELMQIGSGYKFLNTGFSDKIVTYDLGYFKADSYTTGGNGTSSTLNYNKDGVWRNIKIEVKDFKIVRYSSINPKTNDVKKIE